MNNRLAAAVIALALVGLGVHRAVGQRLAAADARRASANAIATACTRVDTLALSVRFAALPSYDPLVDAVAELERALTEMEGASPAAATPALASLRVLVAERAERIEELKARRAALENSERALGIALASPPAEGASEDEHTLRAALIPFLLTRTPAHEDAVEAQRARVAGRVDDTGLVHVSRHIAVVVEGRRLVEDSATRFLRAPLADGARALVDAVANDDASAVRTGRVLESLAWSLLVLVGVVALWRKPR